MPFQVPPPAVATVAYGVAPAWHLVRQDGGWTLVEKGRAAVEATELGHRLTRHGRVLGARTADGRIISVLIVPGLCALSAAHRPAAYRATVRIDERILHGCYVAAVPGERPILD